jgi:ribA/ribD-fused uncharacterized protein
MSDAIERFRGPYGFLSNFHPAIVSWGGAEYPTSEHLYQAMKARSDGEREWVRTAPTPSAAKMRGRTLLTAPGWAERRVGAMREVLREKFGQHPDLAAALAATGDAELVEGNEWGDRFWGKSPDGEGDNWLGKLLMELRASLFGTTAQTRRPG